MHSAKRFYKEIIGMLLVGAVLVPLSAEAQSFTIERLTSNVIGLDHNNYLNGDGPERFLSGYRITNTTGAAINDVSVTWTWTSADATVINLTPGSPTTRTIASLGAGLHKDIYFDITLNRVANAITKTRGYNIAVSAPAATTAVYPISPGLNAQHNTNTREIFVEGLQKQARNDVLSFDGPSTVFVGNTYDYRLVATTATNGYEQLTATVDFPNVLFDITQVQTSYSVPTNATNYKVYADACGLNANPTHTYGQQNRQYLLCVNDAEFPAEYQVGQNTKAGGDIDTFFTLDILAVGPPTGSVVSPIIYDGSGDSWHYNTDYGTDSITVVSVAANCGGRVFRDRNQLVRYEPWGTTPDIPFPGVTVQLISAGPDGILYTGDDFVAQSKVTDSDGVFFFDVTTAGRYRTRVVTVGSPIPPTMGPVSGEYTYALEFTLGPKAPVVESFTNLDLGLDENVLMVDLMHFETRLAEGSKNVVLDWVTAMELSNAGFHVYRATQAKDGKWVPGERLTPDLIPAEGDANGAVYSFVDPAPLSSPDEMRAYYLEDVEINGWTTMHGPAIWSLKGAPSDANLWGNYE